MPRKNESHRLQALPKKFRAGFLSALDGRTDLAKTLRANFELIVADLGGPDVAHIKAALVERFVWAETLTQVIEYELARGEVDRSEALEKWLGTVKALVALAKVLGTDRRSTNQPWTTIIVQQPSEPAADSFVPSQEGGKP
jgi:hypothetical protein